jgi:purine-nucleoside phosphorylase
MADGLAQRPSSFISNTDEMHGALTQAAAIVRQTCGIPSGPVASVALVLGSGLGKFSDRIEQKLSIDYTSIPGMPIPAVSGHAGTLVIGSIGSTRVMCFSGRVHAYEDYRCVQLQFAVRLAALCGVASVVLTNAAGGCQSGMQHGDVMLITETISLHARSFLAETCADPRFGSFSGGDVRDQGAFRPHAGLMQHMRDTANAVDMRLPEGVYCISTGPTYETHTEVAAGMQYVSPGVRFIDAFGMSTVPEAMAASAMGLSFVSLSLISNLAAGIEEGELKHDDVTTVANMSGPKFEGFMHRALLNWPQLPPPHLPAHSASKCLTIAPQPITLDIHLHSSIVDTLRRIAGSSSMRNAVFLISQPLGGQQPLPQCFSNAAMMGLSVSASMCADTLILCSPLNFAILDEEAVLFVSALCCVGMQSMLHCVECSSRCSPPSSYAVVSQSITAASSLSGQSNFTDTADLHQITALGECQPNPAFYFSTPGPLSPTDAEVRLMAPVGALFGNSSLALAYAAQQAGVIVAVIACDATLATADNSIHQLCKASASLVDVEHARKSFGSWIDGLSYVTPRYTQHLSSYFIDSCNFLPLSQHHLAFGYVCQAN